MKNSKKKELGKVLKMQKTKCEKERGITLIALVITVIVLLILAGVTVATLMGDNRDINKSKWGKERDRNCRSKRKSTIRYSKLGSR